MGDARWLCRHLWNLSGNRAVRKESPADESALGSGSQMRGPALAFISVVSPTRWSFRFFTTIRWMAFRRGVAMSTQGFRSDGPIDDSPSRDGASSPAAQRMRNAINAAALGAVPDDELESAARALVNELRLANEPPEQVLLQIKHILAEAGLRPTQGPADPAPVAEHHAHLYRNVIESSIRHYFRDTRHSDPSPA